MPWLRLSGHRRGAPLGGRERLPDHHRSGSAPARREVVHAVLVAVANGRNLRGRKETQMTEPPATPPISTIRVPGIKSGYTWSVSIVADGDTDADVDEARGAHVPRRGEALRPLRPEAEAVSGRRGPDAAVEAGMATLCAILRRLNPGFDFRPCPPATGGPRDRERLAAPDQRDASATGCLAGPSRRRHRLASPARPRSASRRRARRARRGRPGWRRRRRTRRRLSARPRASDSTSAIVSSTLVSARQAAATPRSAT